MSITINHNSMAGNANRNLAATYGKLSTNIQRMSSGLRINSAADDAAGLAIREMMRADISTLQQGLRNAADGISMIQTADGALGIIDEKLTRMKELAEQASTGTYTTVQREIINSEYQAMAAEIDRIANATNFNGIKLLDGSVSNQHGGQGVKIHFGLSNNAAEDYYFINIGDARATSSTGLRVGGDAKNDVWAQGGTAAYGEAAGCCSGGFDSLNGPAGFTDGQSFSFGYNWDWKAESAGQLLTGKYLSGRYTVNSGDSLQDLVAKVNGGTQSRVGIAINSAALAAAAASGGTVAVCIGDEAYYWGNTSAAEGYNKKVHDVKISAAAAESAQVAYKPGGTNPTVWASGDAIDRLENAGINLGHKLQNTSAMSAGVDTATPLTSASASAAIKIVMSAYNEDISAQMAANGLSAGNTVKLTVSSAKATTSAADAAAMSAGISAANGIITEDGAAWSGSGAATIGTGIFTDSAGNWTTSATIAGRLNMTELQAEVTANASAGNSADVTISIGGNSYEFADLAASDLADSIASAAAAHINKGMAAAPNLVRVEGTETVVVKGNVTMAVTDFEAKEQIKPVGGAIDKTKTKIQVDDNVIGGSGKGFTGESLAKAINENSASDFWAMTETNADGKEMVYVFAKEGGSDQNSILACDVAGSNSASRTALSAIEFENVETGEFNQSGTNMSLGGQKWGTMSPVLSKSVNGQETWNVSLNGRDVGEGRDLWIASPASLTLPGLKEDIINGMDGNAFAEVQNAANANWKGAEVRTQSSAQEALDALTEAIVQKDKIRADLGGLQNRLENTMTNLEIQTENLSASESRISDVDVAKEMTEFTKNNVMSQAAVGMLAQANSMSQMALSLIR
jgi:flagellin